jgi:hypothetical protein
MTEQRIKEIEKYLEFWPYVRINKMLSNQFIDSTIMVHIDQGQTRNTNRNHVLDAYAALCLQDGRTIIRELLEEIKNGKS